MKKITQDSNGHLREEEIQLVYQDMENHSASDII